MDLWNHSYLDFRYGKIIISEAFLENKYKTIKPLDNLGGQAGGEKYMYHDIMFKFSTNWKKIYDSVRYPLPQMVIMLGVTGIFRMLQQWKQLDMS